MRNSAAFRLMAHICIYFAVVCLMPPLMLESYLGYFVLTAAVLAFALIAVRFSSPVLRLLASLPSAAALLLVPQAPKALIVGALPVLYAVLTLTVGRFLMEQWRLRKEFKLTAILAAVLFLGGILMTYYNENAAAAEKIYFPKATGPSALIFLAAFFVCSFLALRTIRSGSTRSARWQAGSIGYFLLPLVAGALIGVMLYAPISALSVKTGGVWFFLPEGCVEYKEYEEPLYEMSRRPMATAVPLEIGETPTEAPLTNPPELPRTLRGIASGIPFGTIAAIIGGVLLAALVLFLVLRGKTASKEFNEVGTLERFDEKRVRPALRRRERKTRTNADAVRGVYRRYLAFLRLHGIHPVRSSTSGDISDSSHALLIETDELLRSLYIKARYSGNEITDDELALAEKSLENLTKDENLRSVDDSYASKDGPPRD